MRDRDDWQEHLTSAADKFHIFDRSERRKVEAAAKNLRCVIVDLDLSGVSSEKELLEYIASRLRFADYFGQNWNALLDMLSDMSWWESDRFLFIIEGAQSLFAEDPMTFQTFFEVLQSAAQRMRRTGGSMHVGLIDGASRFKLETAIGVETVCDH